MTRRLRVLLCAAGLAVSGVVSDAHAAAPQILRLDRAFDALVAPDARVETITDGHDWLEGPVWIGGVDGYLLFTDIPRNRVLRWRPRRGVDVFLEPSGYTGTAPFTGREPGANGLTLDAQRRLVLAEHGDRRIARLEADGSKTTLAARYGGRRLNSPNDLVYDRRGNLYFTDPPFGLPGAFDDPARELDFCGVYRLSPDGKLVLLTKQLQAPNGIALSPDQRRLYVTDVGARRPAWWVFELDDGGLARNGRVLLDAAPLLANGPGGPDGLKTDRAGNLYASGPGGVYVLTPQGRLLGRVDLGGATSNLAWGEDGSSLFITAGRAVHRLRLRATGVSP